MARNFAAAAWLSSRKRMEANNPGRVGQPLALSPEGPFSTLIIYEMLPPSDSLKKKKKERKVGEEKEKKY